MRIPIEMQQLAYDMEEATIVDWLKAVGDTVTRGEVIAEVETEKATVEMEALDAGTLVEIVEEAGAEVAVGAVIAYLETES
jgi:pyruvate/2-oxoglutarate dehydrogenase complex dihydrolipoamide acyltransferase (E2) component